MFLGNYQDIVIDTGGAAVAGAIVTVARWDGSAVSIYTNRDATGGAVVGSQVTSDTYGVFSFYARPGVYRLTITNVPGAPLYDYDVVVGGSERFSAEYFGIEEGATNQVITTPLQNWIYELLEHSGGTVPSGRLPCGRIDLPDGFFVTDSLLIHPAVSVFGSNRAGTRLRLADGSTPVGPDNTRAMFYVLARTQGAQATEAWMPMFKYLHLDGNKANQSAQMAYGIYCEKGQNDPDYDDYLLNGEAKGYSAIHAENVEIEGFSADGIRANGDRQRMMLFARTRSINNGLMSGDTVVTEGCGVRILGNDPVITDCGFGGNTGHSILISGCSGLVAHGNNVWGSTSAARSNNALAMHLQNVNGFTVVGNVFNDTVSMFGGESNADRGFTFAGNHMKPNKAVFSADGVCVGTADATCNAFIRVRGYQNAVIGLNDYSADSLGRRYEFLASFSDQAVGFMEFASSSREDPVIKPWFTSNPVPVSIAENSACSVVMHDMHRDMHRFTGQMVFGMSLGFEPSEDYGVVFEGSRPTFFGTRTHFQRGMTLLPGTAQVFESVTSGGSYVVPIARQRVTFYQGSGNTIATYGVTLPDEPDDGHELELVFRDGVRDLTVTMGDVSHSLFGADIKRVPPGTALRFTFKQDESAGTWWVVSSRNDWLNPEGAATEPMSNGGSHTMDPGNVHLHLTRATTCTAWTETLPAAPQEGEVRRISVHQAVTAWTLAPNTGHTLHTTDTWPTTIPAGGYLIEVQFLAGVWYLISKG